jgi:hypothetical protein
LVVVVLRPRYGAVVLTGGVWTCSVCWVSIS